MLVAPLVLIAIADGGEALPAEAAGIRSLSGVLANVNFEVTLLKELVAAELTLEVGHLTKMSVFLMELQARIPSVSLPAARIWAQETPRLFENLRWSRRAKPLGRKPLIAIVATNLCLVVFDHYVSTWRYLEDRRSDR